MHLGIMIPNWIGDTAMATPTLRALRNHFGSNAKITGIMRPYVAEVLAGTSWLDQQVFYDRRSNDQDLQTSALITKLRRLRIDTMLLMTNSLRAAMIACLGGVRRRVGYVRYCRRLFLTDCLHPPRRFLQLAPISAVDYYLNLAYCIGCPSESTKLELATCTQDEEDADEVWRNLKLTNTERVVLLNTGSANNAARDWPRKRFAQLAQQIVTQHDAEVVVICGPKERESAAEIESRAAHPRVKSLANEHVPIGASKAIIRRSQLLVSTDSGPRHLAAGFQVPTVAIFGPTDPQWTANYNPNEVQIRAAKGQMAELSVDQVFDAVCEQLQSPASNRAA